MNKFEYVKFEHENGRSSYPRRMTEELNNLQIGENIEVRFPEGVDFGIDEVLIAIFLILVCSIFAVQKTLYATI